MKNLIEPVFRLGPRFVNVSGKALAAGALCHLPASSIYRFLS